MLPSDGEFKTSSQTVELCDFSKGALQPGYFWAVILLSEQVMNFAFVMLSWKSLSKRRLPRAKERLTAPPPGNLNGFSRKRLFDAQIISVFPNRSSTKKQPQDSPRVPRQAAVLLSSVNRFPCVWLSHLERTKANSGGFWKCSRPFALLKLYLSTVPSVPYFAKTSALRSNMTRLTQTTRALSAAIFVCPDQSSSSMLQSERLPAPEVATFGAA